MRDDVSIDWTIAPTPPGWSGRLERLMGPGKTRAEYIVEFGGGALCAGLLAWYVLSSGAYREWSTAQLIVFALVGFDMVGGVLTNATNAAKRWYHRAGPGTARFRLLFVSVHLLHLAAIAFLFPPAGWSWLLANAALLLGSAVLIESVPLEVKRPVAMTAYLAALLVNLTLFPLPAALSWFVPFFYLKLLVCHLVPEAPMTRPHPADVNPG